MSTYSCIRKLFLLFAIMLFNAVKAQHYIFIEAEGQQPFYLKKGTSMVSSSSMGFLIVPKITSSEMEFTIGFPKNAYPEISFYINGTDRDRGFQLRNFEVQGWCLFDRSSLEMIKGDAGANDATQLHIDKKNQGSFGAFLSAATDDKSLLTPLPTNGNVQKPSTAKSRTNSTISTAKTTPKETLPLKDAVKAPMITASTEIDNEFIKQIVFIEKSSADKADTVLVQIDKVKSNSIPKAAMPKPDSSFSIVKSPDAGIQKPDVSTSPAIRTNPIVVCDRPFGDYKDIRSLQRKLLGMTGEEEQLAYAVKVFGQKCFNTKQALEIGWFFVDEKSRLKLFTLLKPLIADPVSFRDLESSFFKEENISAFRALFFGGK